MMTDTSSYIHTSTTLVFSLFLGVEDDVSCFHLPWPGHAVLSFIGFGYNGNPRVHDPVSKKEIHLPKPKKTTQAATSPTCPPLPSTKILCCLSFYREWTSFRHNQPSIAQGGWVGGRRSSSKPELGFSVWAILRHFFDMKCHESTWSMLTSSNIYIYTCNKDFMVSGSHLRSGRPLK